jgi:hypothetical protein
MEDLTVILERLLGSCERVDVVIFSCGCSFVAAVGAGSNVGSGGALAPQLAVRPSGVLGKRSQIESVDRPTLAQLIGRVVLAGGFGAAVGDQLVDDAACVPSRPFRPNRVVLDAGEESGPGVADRLVDDLGEQIGVVVVDLMVGVAGPDLAGVDRRAQEFGLELEPSGIPVFVAHRPGGDHGDRQVAEVAGLGEQKLSAEEQAEDFFTTARRLRAVR